MKKKVKKVVKRVAKRAKKDARKIVKKADRKHHAKSKGQHKVDKVMREYKEGKLHSGSKKGPKVKNPKQAIAIALSEARKTGAKIPKKK